MSVPDFNPPAVGGGIVLKQPREAVTAGTVVALSGEAARYTRFFVCMQSLGYQLPAGSSVRFVLGSDIAESRNQACEEMEGDWVWFIDDDHAFRDDVLVNLLKRNEDIVTPICLRRAGSFLPIPAVDGDFMDLSKYGSDDLVEVEHAGSSGMLIRREVIEALEPPWFELGRLDDGRRISEDVNFCRRAREAGFKIHVDLGVRLGHITTAVVWPVWNEELGRWLTGFTVADGSQLAIELGQPTEDDVLEDKD